MLKTLIIATVLLPRLTIAQQSQQLLQPRQPGQWSPVGWMASGSHCVPGSDKAATQDFGSDEQIFGAESPISLGRHSD